MRILLVVPGGAAPLDTGGGQRSALFHRALRRLGELDVVLLQAKDGDWGTHPTFPGSRVIDIGNDTLAPIATTRVARAIQVVSKVLFVGRVIAPDERAASAFAQVLGEGRYDLIVFRFFPTLVTVFPALREARTSRLALDLDDRDDQKYRAAISARLGEGLVSRGLARWISIQVGWMFQRYLKDVQLLWVVTPDDRLKSFEGVQRVAPNVALSLPGAEKVVPAGEGRTVLFVGGAGHRPNVDGVRWFLTACWPRIVARKPDAAFRLVGGGDWAGALGDAARLPGVSLAGRVEDLGPEYSAARLAVVPVPDGGGSKIKLVEACAFSRPVVSTAHGVRGFETTLGAGLRIHDDAAAFAEACLELLLAPETASAEGAALGHLQRSHLSADGISQMIAEDLGAIGFAGAAA